MKTTTRNLSDGSILTVTIENGNYSSKISTNTRNFGFEGDSGEVKENETVDSIADELANFMNDNLNS